MASPTKVLVLSVCLNCFALPKSTSTKCPSPESMQFSVFRSLGREEEGRGEEGGWEGSAGEGMRGEGRGEEGRGKRREEKKKREGNRRGRREKGRGRGIRKNGQQERRKGDKGQNLKPFDLCTILSVFPTRALLATCLSSLSLSLSLAHLKMMFLLCRYSKARMISPT